MLKRLFCSITVPVLLCFLIITGCGSESLPKPRDNANASNTDTNGADDLYKVVRYPLLENNQTEEFSAYYESGLLYPNQDEVVEPGQTEETRVFELNGNKYTAKYSMTKKYSDDASVFLKEKSYDVYKVDGKMDIQVFRNSGVVKKFFVYEEELNKSSQLVYDFSEAGLKSAAETVLADLYGTGFSEYLRDYYSFEYAKLMEYSNEEQNRYVVCYRAYINDIPTDDVLYVQFSLSGMLWNVSAQRYLQYANLDTNNLTPIKQMEEMMGSYLSQLGYSKTGLRETEVPCYYTMNSQGELYYVMEWEAFQTYTEETGATCVEVLAIKASR